MLKLVNRNLQFTFAGGVVFFTMASLTDCKELFATLSRSDSFLMIALIGLPLMLSWLGNAHRPRLERALARITAATVCLVVAINAYALNSQNLLLLLGAVGIVMVQVTIMRALQSKGEPA